MPDSDRVDLKPGDVLAGKYRVERVLGAGGMGVVVAAHHLQLDEKVALKFLHPDAIRTAEAMARFLREAQASAKIKSEHVARVTDVGQLENGLPYMVMEYLEGEDLADRLEAHGAMPIPQAVDFVLQTCEALADAHSLGIVHRDLKPANLFCIERSDGQLAIKVLDFGISKVKSPEALAHDMTRTNAVMGSPPYMSPEQMKQTKGVDARADIWSLGVILFELLTGRLPFDSPHVTELAIKVASEPPPLLREHRPEAPAGLEQVIATCLEKDCARRFQTVGELAIALKDFAPKGARISVERVLGTLRKAGMSETVLASSGEHEAAARARAAAVAAKDAQRTPQGATAWGHTATGTRSRRVVTGAAVAIALGGLVVVVAQASRETTVSRPPLVRDSASTESSVAATSPRVAPVLSPAVEAVVPVVDVSMLPVVPPAASIAPPPALASTSTSAKGTPRAAHAAGAASSKSGCNPPYVIDSAGHRQYKPECLN
jgi:tRNA A-37 threonylcarbamoyl transferase component Bud32